MARYEVHRSVRTHRETHRLAGRLVDTATDGDR